MIVLVDYGVGNLQSLARAFNTAGAEVSVSGDAEVLQRADAIVLPGVGHFQEAMEHLRNGGLISVLEQRVRVERTPLLGVCLGMQLLMRRSEEGNFEGLGWLETEVRSLRALNPDQSLKIPHIGWNNAIAAPESILFRDVPGEACFYFAHSFAATEAPQESRTARTTYGPTFISAVEQENLFATQFHPEKSHQNGLHILRNFLAHVHGN
jgi:glutamine amidotransferase